MEKKARILSDVSIKVDNGVISFSRTIFTYAFLDMKVMEEEPVKFRAVIKPGTAQTES